MPLRSPVCLIVGWLVALVPWPALAQVNIELFQPPAGDLVSPTIPMPMALKHTDVSVGTWLSYGRGISDPQDHERPLRVSDLASAQLGAAIGLLDRFELGVVMPIGLVRASDTSPAAFSTVIGPGDLRAQLSVGVVEHGGFRLSLLNVVSVPIGHPAVPFTDRQSTWTSALVAGITAGRVELGARFGLHVRPRGDLSGVELADELRGALGAHYRVTRLFGGFAELATRMGVFGRTAARGEHSLVGLLGVRARPWDWFSADLGVGSGAFPLPQGYGTSDVRVVLGLRLTSRAVRPLDAPSGKPEAPACGEGAGSGDGRCRIDADHDRVPDEVDRCPRLAEDHDGYQDADGCPEPDNDRDSVLDADDQCPMEPEDRDAYEDHDGCPEPGPGALAITVTENQIQVSSRIYFESGEDVIRSVSKPALDAVAKAIEALSPDKRVHVIGHTDRAGELAQNRDLSYRRARAVVEYLRGRGVPDGRLSFEGLGGDEPLVDGDSPEARAMNRRVEFRILDPRER